MIPPSGKGARDRQARLECAKTFGATSPVLAKYCRLCAIIRDFIVDPAQNRQQSHTASPESTRERNSQLAILECGEVLQNSNKRLILNAALGHDGGKRLNRSISISMPGTFRLEFKVPVPALVQVLARAPPRISVPGYPSICPLHLRYKKGALSSSVAG